MDYERKPTTALAGVFIISNAALGAGTLAFPQAFAKTGLYLSLPILAVSIVFGCSFSIELQPNLRKKLELLKLTV